MEIIKNNYRCLIFSGNYCLSPSAGIPPYMWTAGLVDNVHTINEPTGSDSPSLSEKRMAL